MLTGKIWNINRLYPYNLAEGEGAGTSYEYYAKTLALQKMWKRCSSPRSILIAGLPEIYGLSMDFIIWGKIFNCPVTILEDRKSVIEKLSNCLDEIGKSSLEDVGVPKIILVDSLDNIDGSIEGKYDLVFSCEVLQRLSNKEGYVKALAKRSDYMAFFAPNEGNSAHATKSGLKTLSLEDIISLAVSVPEKRIFSEGYIDFPPWPPGVKRSEGERKKAESGLLEKGFFQFCQVWARLERIIPLKYRYKYSHIVYIFLEPVME